MNMKNRKGSILIMTLLIFVVLMIFGTFISGFMVNENKMSLNHQYKTQAYYIARSGAVAVEAAIMDMDENERESLSEELDKGEIRVKEIQVGEGKANVLLKIDDNKLIIESKGNIGKVDSLAIKVMEVEEGINQMGIKHAIFSMGNINLGNGSIDGDIGTNNSIKITGNPSLKGDAYLMKDQNISAPDWWKNAWTSNNSIKDLVQEQTYKPIKFPSFPINNSTINFIQGGADQTTITKSQDYNKFEVNSKTNVYIDTTHQDIILNIKQFNLNNGHIYILGNNKLTLYVGNMTIGSGSTINYHEGQENNNPGDSKKVDIFHNGNSKLNIQGNVKIVGNLYVEKADLELDGSGSILGNVYYNGENIVLSGDSDITKGLLYAPNADIKFTGSGKVHGAVIGKTITINGGGIVKFDPKYIDTSIIDQEFGEILFKPGYFK